MDRGGGEFFLSALTNYLFSGKGTPLFLRKRLSIREANGPARDGGKGDEKGGSVFSTKIAPF